MNKLSKIKTEDLPQCQRELTTVSHGRGKRGVETPLEGCYAPLGRWRDSFSQLAGGSIYRGIRSK